ncbi:hypothetical protein [Myroides odoratus]|uniref:hypothetical protein n=1 Tax=Myroides odoratus TaxID=256 RepID=UPI00333E9A02
MMTNNQPHPARKDGFKTPEGYFDTLDTRLFDRLAQREEQLKPRAKIFRLTPVKQYASIAAAVTLLLGLGIFLKVKTTSAISTEALEQYLEYDPAYTWSNDLIQSFDEGDIKELEHQINVNQKEINDYVQTNIDLDYYLNY